MVWNKTSISLLHSVNVSWGLPLEVGLHLDARRWRLFITWTTLYSSSLTIRSSRWHCTPPKSWSNMERREQPRGKWLNGLGLWSYIHVSNLETGPACGLLYLNQSTGLLLLLARAAWIGTVSICCGGMSDGSIIHMHRMRVQAIRSIGGNLLNTFLIILMSIENRSSFLWISSVLMFPYRDDMYRVVIGSILFCWCMWQWAGSGRKGRRFTMLHSDGRGLWCGSGLLSLQSMR